MRGILGIREIGIIALFDNKIEGGGEWHRRKSTSTDSTWVLTIVVSLVYPKYCACCFPIYYLASQQPLANLSPILSCL